MLLGASLLGQERIEEAESLLLAAFEEINTTRMPGYYAVGPDLADAAKRLVRLYEAKNCERSAAVGAQSVEFLGVYFDILSLAEFVTGQDFVIRDFSVDRADLLVLDASTAASVQLVKMEVAFLPVEGIECLDREGHQIKGGRPLFFFAAMAMHLSAAMHVPIEMLALMQSTWLSLHQAHGKEESCRRSEDIMLSDEC